MSIGPLMLGCQFWLLFALNGGVDWEGGGRILPDQMLYFGSTNCCRHPAI